MTHQKTAGHAPALGVVRPAFRIDTTGQVTLEPCTHCGQMAVCLPVMGRQGIRTYPYCVEKCWPAAFNGSQQTTNNRAMCRSPALRTMRDVPHCIFCKDRLRPHQYERGVCGECR
ncbi:hypothetical protein [Aeromonas veronii]|uniref:hypothetical protein n=1 Tax=Aeromonas veronii TaxID=654 RepID=UPI001F24F3C5|nr:hypothetical protein [Aeromonas veronii]